MSTEILIASNNPDKLLELEALLAKLELKLHLLKELPAFTPTEEDCDTIAGNAMKKALEAAKHTRMITLADDTGFFIEALSGEPDR
ncbi:MAG: non-canonical purine NTP pyrophosphatase, partial [Candidatus Cloacimonas sp.]|nr:non-canonical purine NTP pyrophosphatase [Candidatus Cloacimonas sp.]